MFLSIYALKSHPGALGGFNLSYKKNRLLIYLRTLFPVSLMFPVCVLY